MAFETYYAAIRGEFCAPDEYRPLKYWKESRLFVQHTAFFDPTHMAHARQGRNGHGDVTVNLCGNIHKFLPCKLPTPLQESHHNWEKSSCEVLHLSEAYLTTLSRSGCYVSIYMQKYAIRTISGPRNQSKLLEISPSHDFLDVKKVTIFFFQCPCWHHWLILKTEA